MNNLKNIKFGAWLLHCIWFSATLNSFSNTDTETVVRHHHRWKYKGPNPELETSKVICLGCFEEIFCIISAIGNAFSKHFREIFMLIHSELACENGYCKTSLCKMMGGGYPPCSSRGICPPSLWNPAWCLACFLVLQVYFSFNIN
jgi:hypothetical protein